ncbi:MAG TPA: GNVR domain-containing protein [candidate division Zixibacteria bacterium]|nr:GNVR domain-containing protein [candidate division Zixibacteria bacterium]
MGQRLELHKPAPENGPDRSASSAEFHFNFFAALRTIFKRRRWLATVTLSAGALAAAITLLIPNQYTATARLLPSGGDNLSALKGMTGLSILDLARGGAGDANSSELFPAILTSDRIRNTVLTSRFEFGDGGERRSLTLQEYLEEENLDKARLELERIVGVATEFKTGVITLTVTTRYPELSARVAQKFIDELDTFNRTQRATKATEYKRYVAGQLSEAEARLADAEEAFNVFQGANRDWAQSSDPDLQQELLRLKRDLEVKSKTYIMLTQQFEIAKAEAQKDLPVVQALDAPHAPLVKSAPKRTITVALAMLAAALAGLTVVFLREGLTRAAQGANRGTLSLLRDDIRASYPSLYDKLARRAVQTNHNTTQDAAQRAERETIGGRQ